MDPSTLVPLVRHFWKDAPSAPAADVELSADDSPVLDAFMGDLMIMYAFDGEDSLTILSARMLRELGPALTRESLRERAVAQLRQRIPEVRRHTSSGRLGMLVAGGTFEASLLLLPEVWSAVGQGFGGAILAIAPARDLLFFADEADGGAQALADMARRVMDDPTCGNKMSPQLMRLGTHGWELFALP